MKQKPVVMEPEDVALVAEPSTLLSEAIDEYEKSRPELNVDDFRKAEEAWSLLASQVVGSENL